jgi:hypothetical protein
LQGGERNARNLEELKTLGVTAVLNVSWEVADFYPDHFEYGRLNIQDYANQDIARYFEEGFEFIGRSFVANSGIAYDDHGTCRLVSKAEPEGFCALRPGHLPIIDAG